MLPPAEALDRLPADARARAPKDALVADGPRDDGRGPRARRRGRPSRSGAPARASVRGRGRRRRGRPPRQAARLPDGEPRPAAPSSSLPPRGIYAGAALGHRAAISIGVNPHYGGDDPPRRGAPARLRRRPLRAAARVELWERLRDERAFDSEAELVEAIAADVDGRARSRQTMITARRSGADPRAAPVRPTVLTPPK